MSQSSPETHDMSKKYPQFLLLGDSIVQFGSYLRDGVSLVAGLAEHCDRRLDVVNRGLSGYTTANILSILPHLIPSPTCAKVDYLLILFGANDACLPSSPSNQHVQIDKFQENLKTVITHPSVQAHKPKILLVTPPPINEYQLQVGDKAKGYEEMSRTAWMTHQYAGRVRRVASRTSNDDNVVLIDLWMALRNEALKLDGIEEMNVTIGGLKTDESPGLRSLLADGLHLTGAGYQVFLNEIVQKVGEKWKEEPANDPSWIFPHWSIAPRID